LLFSVDTYTLKF